MQTSLLGIANKAKQDKKYKFGKLYELIDKEALYEAWRKINKSSAAGVDKETATKILYKWFNRRSQKRSFNFEELNEKMKYYGLIRPRVMEGPYKQMSIDDYSFA